MRQTLLELPLDGPPGFGLIGFPMLAWVLVGAVWLVWHRKDLGSREAWFGPLMTWLFLAAVIALLPLMPFAAGRKVPIYGYGFMLFVGLLAAGTTAARRARTVGLLDETVWDMAMWLIFAGILGGRVWYVVQYSDRVFAGTSTPWEWFVAFVSLPKGGLVFYGSVVGGAVAFAAFVRKKRLNPLKWADLIVPSIFLGLAFGRIGCLLNGCCYGGRCDIGWGIPFPKDSVPYEAYENKHIKPLEAQLESLNPEIDALKPEIAAINAEIAANKAQWFSADGTETLPLHPTQIYSSLCAFLLAGLTAYYFRKRPRDGAVLAAGMLAYPVVRFTIEFLRNDEMGKFSTSLTISQWGSMALFAAGLLFVYWLARRPAAEISKQPPDPPVAVKAAKLKNSVSTGHR